MAYEYDRFEREEGGGSFLMGLLAGTVLGAGLGMLFAPKAGSELRSQIGNQLADQTRQAPRRGRPVLSAGDREGQPDRRSRQGGLRPRALQREQHGGAGDQRRVHAVDRDQERGRHDQHVRRRVRRLA